MFLYESNDKVIWKLYKVLYNLSYKLNENTHEYIYIYI